MWAWQTNEDVDDVDGRRACAGLPFCRLGGLKPASLDKSGLVPVMALQRSWEPFS